MVSEKDSGREISRETRMTAAIIARFMGFRILRMLSLGEKSVLSPLPELKTSTPRLHNKSWSVKVKSAI